VIAGPQAREEMIHIVGRTKGAAQVRFGGCSTVVSLWLSSDGEGGVHVGQSHWIRPPDAPRRGRFTGMGLKQTLGAAIGDLAVDFSRGLKDGHQPDESWFVPTPDRIVRTPPSTIPPF